MLTRRGEGKKSVVVFIQVKTRHSGQAKRDPESSPRPSSEDPGCRINSGMTAKNKGLIKERTS
jgi:hypothetical protein